MLYYIRRQDTIYLIAIYSKTDQDDIALGRITSTIDDIES